MIFDQYEFFRFCKHLKIDSKEFGIIPLELIGSQRYLIKQIALGLKDGIHDFYVLKARQLGISTVGWALDLYWLFKYPGLRGSLVTHDEETREECRANITSYLDSLPVSYKVPARVHNRNMLDLLNRSRFSYQVAGTKKSGKLGRGKGLNFLHATELSSWGDEEGLNSLIDSLAENFKRRLYLFESTARGFNLWYDLYQEAKKSVTQMAVFIGWWRNELYRVEKDSEVFEVYGYDDPTPSEREWIDQVDFLYGFQIRPEQLAWARWKLHEKHRGNETSFYQEFPPLEDYAWQMSGSKFFNSRKLTETRVMLDKEKPPASFFRYQIGTSFDQTELIPSSPIQSHLTIWEDPDPLGYYAIAADPAYGSSTTSDRFCVEVFKCFADGIDQVAEYCTTECHAYAFAWIIAHLAGAYRNSSVILEINGPGQAVWDEVQRVQRTAGAATAYATNAGLLEVVSNMRNYLYHRSDSLAGNYAWHFKMTNELKESICNKLRDSYERGIFQVRSLELLEEMKTITNEDGIIGAGSARQKDDRVIAAALATECWQADWLPELYEKRWTRAEAFATTTLAMKGGQQNILNLHLSNWLARFRPEVET